MTFEIQVLTWDMYTKCGGIKPINGIQTLHSPLDSWTSSCIHISTNDDKNPAQIVASTQINAYFISISDQNI
jgi:hypothetical protein